MPKVPEAIRMFAPERWGTVDYFAKFYSTTYQFSAVQRRAVSGVSAHFNKAQYLLALAHKLKPNLQIDAAELEQNGYSAIHNSHELGTVIEAAILELYAVLDCTAKVIHAVHGKTTRGLKDSTSGLFKNIGKAEGSIPDAIRKAILDAHWYNQILLIRSEITHLMPGSCHLDRDSDFVRYMHTGLLAQGKPLIIDDVFGWLDTLIVSINRFIGLVFHHLSAKFDDKPIHEICGMVQGRLLHRYIRPTYPAEKITFDSGECGAWVWFEKPENPTCPFTEVCGAYERKAPAEGWET